MIELWVPQLRTLPPGRRAAVFDLEPGYTGIDTYDPVNQIVISHHFRFPPDGFGPTTDVTLSRTPHRYIWPPELDLMARLAGFTLQSRHGDWFGGEFTDESPTHVSVYRLPTSDKGGRHEEQC